ncbi:unnamed protein product [Prorocentrum cordatum]|uniref:MRPL25 domain-containing protein n=1 Tax=Prorocentrum cordatum TaxID=2364126 RepID=A0ABN9W225_9DINO|nr:unnamed protein product [Polarella glacialis]
MLGRLLATGARPGPLRLGTRAFAPAVVHKDPNLLSGAERGALERIGEDAELQGLSRSSAASVVRGEPPEGAVVVRSHNGPAPHAGSNFPVQAYAAHPHNFTPLRPVAHGFSALDRAVRDTAWESRFDLLERRIQPTYCGECRGTPRRELQDGMVAGIRVRPVQNPYAKLTRAQKYRLNTWPSRNWTAWTPHRCNVRGSRRRYRVPEDINPYRDELGEWHPPRVSGRYKADIEKQFYMNSLPWVWQNDYYLGKQHFMDREPRGPKRWYKREFRRAQVAEALRRADTMVEEYKKERREKKRLSWVEQVVLEFCGEQASLPYVRERRIPKM